VVEPMKARLIPLRNVEVRGGAFYANVPTPWLRLDCEVGRSAGRWIEISYGASLLERLTRPILRCVGPGGNFDHVLPGALFGRAFWVGFIPRDTTELQISPTDHCGRFDFAIFDLHALSWPELLLRVGLRKPRRLVQGLYAGLLGREFMAEIHFRRALSATPLEAYDAWRKARVRPMDLESFDAPHSDWRSGPEIRLVVDARAGDGSDLRSMVSDLKAQPYPHWSLGVVGPRGPAEAIGEKVPIDDKRIRFIGEDAKLVELLSDLAPRDFIAPVGAQEEVPVYMLAALAEAASREPKTELFYGDEDSIDVDGKYLKPRLRPDWSEVFFRSEPDLGAALFFKVEAIARVSGDMTLAGIFRAPEQATVAVVATSGSVEHIRRVMRTRKFVRERREITSTNSRRRVPSSPLPAVTIIVPTRDQAGLLRQFVESLKQHPSRQIEILIVDNGSTQADAVRLLAEIGDEEDTRILYRPGPFNFARLCNEAVALARADTLLFLNNDIELIEDDWLAPLLYWASRDDVGAVGSKLLYPNGKVQHAGVILGVDGRAGHFERMLDARDPGYFGRLCAPHEVSAVTGACLAVQKRKFEAVGGFDAENLPVELNDIDLCLRLAGRGWKCICACESILAHHESMSRGKTSRPNQRYAKEIQFFRSKWMHKLRDDPYFHPALSLDSLDATLG
jgi:GT2 family glycosyltransferase